MRLKLAVLLSGSGTTLENIFECNDRGEIDVDVAVVIGTRAEAFGLERARRRGVATAVVNPRDFKDDAGFSARLTEVIEPHGPELILLAGFMFMYTIPPQFTGRVMNVHPALIPAFCGKGMYGHHVHEAVIARGTKVTGCTVHFVDNVYDNGPIILQKTVTVTDDDTPDTLAERVQAAEREAFPEAVRLFAEGRLKIEGRRVRILGKAQR